MALKELVISKDKIEKIKLYSSYKDSPFSYGHRIQLTDKIESSWFGLVKKVKKAGVYSKSICMPDYDYKGTVEDVLNEHKNYKFIDGDFYIKDHIVVTYVSKSNEWYYFDSYEDAKKQFDQLKTEHTVNIEVI